MWIKFQVSCQQTDFKGREKNVTFVKKNVSLGSLHLSEKNIHLAYSTSNNLYHAYMQKTCDVAEKAILAKINLRKKCVNRDKM